MAGEFNMARHSALCIALALLAVSCGNRNGSDNRASRTPAAETGTPPASGAATTSGVSQENAAVTVTGCLQGSSSAPVGTAGDRTGAVTDQSAGVGDRFVLTHAIAAPADQGQNSAGSGVGANGAGASGGPLVSGSSSYALVGNASELRPHVTHEVRITGRVDPRMTEYQASSRAAGNAGSSASTPSSSGTAGSAAAAGRGSGTGMRTINVESIQMVAATCRAQ
jgi:hypothetical protein